MTGLLEQVLHGFNVFTLGYFVVLQLTFTVLAVVGWRAIEDYVERRPMRDYQAVAESEMSMPVSILVPAYNEEPLDRRLAALAAAPRSSSSSRSS